MRAFLWRSIVLAGIGWVLAEGELHAPLVSMALVCAVAAASVAFHPPLRSRLRPSHLPALGYFFVRESLLGGWDVARRALAPSLPLAPGIVPYPLTLPPGFPTALFAWLVSLTPGTASVCVDAHARVLLVHALDTHLPVERSLSELEAHVERAFATAAAEP